MAQTDSRMRAMTGRAGAAVMILIASASLIAQAPSPHHLAADPDVQGAERLFSAWLEGQMLDRGLPGVAVGVVADQDLVWTAGFGFADAAAKIPMTPHTRFRMASHSKLFTATEAVGYDHELLDIRSHATCPGLPSRRQRATIRQSPSRSCSPTAPASRVKRALTGRRSSSPAPSSCAS